MLHLEISNVETSEILCSEGKIYEDLLVQNLLSEIMPNDWFLTQPSFFRGTSRPLRSARSGTSLRFRALHWCVNADNHDSVI